jgi:hypothetical protein
MPTPDAIYRRIGELIALDYASKGAIDLRPTEAMRQAAKRGLELRRKAPKSRKGGLTAQQASDAGVGSGVQRASDIINGESLSPETWRRMKAFFDRHSAFKDKHTIDPPSKSYISWLLWGGDSAYSRAKQVVAKLDAMEDG